MFQREWNVLLVDDEPDVLSVSRLAMRSFTVYGAPLHIHTAQSKAEAVELLKTTLRRRSGQPNLAVAFIDVVMETDQAGLELCQFIREEQQNKLTQLFVRTGQPGIAPEREVIDRYDINGYFTKVEATEDKLYSLVKSGIRQYYFLLSAFQLSQLLHLCIAAAGSRERMTQIMRGFPAEAQADATGSRIPGLDLKLWEIVDGQVIGGVAVGQDSQALDLYRRLSQLPGTPLNGDGDKYVIEGNNLLLKIAGGPTTAELYFVAEGVFPPPEMIVRLWHQHHRSVAALWKQTT
jgi:CheY-like chemotaxis protein